MEAQHSLGLFGAWSKILLVGPFVNKYTIVITDSQVTSYVTFVLFSTANSAVSDRKEGKTGF